MSNLKIGSLAIIIKANNPENIGKVVEVIDLTRERIIDVKKYNDKECGRYANYEQDLIAVVCGDNLLTKFELSRYVQLNKISVIPVTWLMPLDGYQENTDDYEVIEKLRDWNMLNIKIADKAGNPISGAIFISDEWFKPKLLTTDNQINEVLKINTVKLIDRTHVIHIWVTAKLFILSHGEMLIYKDFEWIKIDNVTRKIDYTVGFSMEL